MASDFIYTPPYQRLTWSGATVVIPDTSPELLWEILLRNCEIIFAGQLVALSSANADGSSPDVTGYVWESSGLGSGNPPTTGVAPVNFLVPDNQKNEAGTSDAWRPLFNVDATWSKIRGRMIWDPGACTLDWHMSGITSALSDGKRGSGHRAATNRRSLVLGCTSGSASGTIYYRSLG